MSNKQPNTEISVGLAEAEIAHELLDMRCQRMEDGGIPDYTSPSFTLRAKLERAIERLRNELDPPT